MGCMLPCVQLIILERQTRTLPYVHIINGMFLQVMYHHEAAWEVAAVGDRIMLGVADIERVVGGVEVDCLRVREGKLRSCESAELPMYVYM